MNSDSLPGPDLVQTRTSEMTPIHPKSKESPQVQTPPGIRQVRYFIRLQNHLMGRDISHNFDPVQTTVVLLSLF